MIDVISSIVAGNKAEGAQTEAANRMGAFSKDIYDQQRADNAPWREAGQRAVGKMEDADYMRDFTMADYQADPGYQFRMDEGQKALEKSAAARGGLMSGGFMKGLAKYSQGVASQEYQNAYDRFNSDRDRRFGRLSQLSGMGQQANALTGQAAGQYMQAGNEAISAIGNAQAAKWKNIHSSVQKWQDRDAEMAGKGMGAAATMFCDERLKQNIKPLTKEEVRSIRSTIKPYFFTYKNQEHGKGQFIGPLAQDLEKNPHTRELVFENEKGQKCIDLHKMGMLLLALEGMGA
jgi:hypothetical protein